MEFKEILQKYHVEPLHYADGSELTESDYGYFYLILQKYYFAKKILKQPRIPSISEALKNKVIKLKNEALWEPSVEDLFDVLMDQGGKVIK